MKILDWMHRKLHPATNYSRVSHTKAPAFDHDAVDRIESAHRPPSPVGTEPDIETPLLLHINLAGILTIGTLGHSHPLFFPHFAEEPTLDLPEKEIPAEAKYPSQIALFQPVTESSLIKTEQYIVEVHRVPEEKIMAEPLLKEDREKKERTTLADLLASEVASNAGPIKSAPFSDLMSGVKEKKKKMKKKVKTKKKGDDLKSSQSQSFPAAEMMHRMIARMVKKKIHPEATAPGRKGGGAADVATDPLLLSGGGGGGAA